MNETYLFDKTGTESEIEQLEKLLTVYKIEPVAPSIVRARLSESKPVLGFRMIFGGVFALATLVLSLGVGAAVYLMWTPTAAVEVQATAEPTQPFRSIVDPAGPATESKHNISRMGQPRRSFRADPVKRDVRKVEKTNAPVSEFAKLTPEERHAYNEVLAALWLTGSKLRVVQDTINRTDDKTNEK
jgi:hypothetical protein